jgi:4-amino-4-deoxy-L-arabinose transferase-like glycosyltransferase
MKPKTSPFTSFFRTHGAIFILVAILLVAAAFRLYHLNVLPAGLHPDEAANGLDIVQRIFHHDWRVIYATNGPREALFFYLQAIFVWLLGNTIFALRLAPALLSILAVYMVYLFTKDWFGRRTALLAAFLMAVNPWVVTIGRDGFRAGMVPLIIAALAFFAGRAYTRQKLIYFILAGAIFGLGFYTYTAFWLFSLVPLGGLVFLAFKNRPWLKANVVNLIISIAVTLAVLVPLGVTIARNPSASTARAGGTSFLNSDLNNGKPAQTLLAGTAKTILQFNFYGDSNSRHNLPGEPLVNTFVGIMLILGLLVAFSRITSTKYAAILAMFFVMMLPAILTAEGLPHALRSIGTAASVFTLAAIGIDYLLTRWYATFPVNGLARTTAVVMISFLMFLTLIQGWRQYFVAWAQDPATYAAYSENMTQIAQFINANNGGKTTFLIAGGYESMPTLYLTNNKANYTLLDTNGLRDLALQNTAQLFVFPASDNSNTLIELLKAKYPNGILTPHYSPFDNSLLFYSFEVS